MNDSSHNRTLPSSTTVANPPFVWVPSSETRGTFQIFSLCASTTVICIWSAVHRDIPPKRLNGLPSYTLQATWVFAALFLPEFVFVYALKQFLDARQSLIDHDTKAGEASPFTLVHAFYAMTGGYAFGVDAPTDESSDEKRIRAIITPAGVRYLMDHDPDLTPDFSELSIQARSKSNGLNKALLVFQLLWFCTSCISRLASHLPLTLLEVVTAAHGLCTLATYAAWWHKPLNVEEPTLIIGEHAREAYAFLRMAANRYAISDEELENLSKEYMVLNAPTETESMIKTMLNLLGEVVGAASISSYVEISIADSSVLTLLTAMYGLVHLSGWNAQFPTTMERILWRIATVGICSCGACFSVSIKTIALLQNIEWPNKALEFFGNFVSIFLNIAVLLIFPFYLLSTLYILVESIRKLFFLPPNAFVVASWSNYFPHFS
ncbi:hypothetical protein SCHPADRAFT_840846 [Schizopora paradoxa]|uniref:Uncharacterized protein n=1 Tax=Schizopora paradoxa TaxID=27342 RepID=A0A0H2RHC0_9AGAM|nr:hypothetical protein SCHPADRAFT_840846 [Schizopora paradoxa]